MKQYTLITCFIFNEARKLLSSIEENLAISSRSNNGTTIRNCHCARLGILLKIHYIQQFQGFVNIILNCKFEALVKNSLRLRFFTGLRITDAKIHPSLKDVEYCLRQIYIDLAISTHSNNGSSITITVVRALKFDLIS